MTKNDYLEALRQKLRALPDDEALRAVEFYRETIEDRIEAGMPEEEAVAQMEPPAVAAERIVSELPAVPRVIARRKLSGHGVGNVFVWAAVVLGSPLWVSLLLAALATVASVYIGFLAIIVSAWVLTEALLAGLPISILSLFLTVGAHSAPLTLMNLGVGLVLSGLGLFALMGTLAITRLVARVTVRFTRWAVSPFWKMPERPQAGRPRGLSPVWRIVCLVAAALVVAGAVAGTAGYAMCGFSPARLAAETERVARAAEDAARAWAGVVSAPAGTAGAAWLDPARHAPIAETAEALAQATPNPAERLAYRAFSLLAQGLGL